MKAVLINTTFLFGHHGCLLVNRQLDLLAAEAGIDICAKLPLECDWQKLAPADFDLVLVNGEGALHHDSKAARRLAAVPLWAQERGRPAFLINSVYQANGPEIAAGIARYHAIFARDELSCEALTKAGINATVVPDLTLTWEPSLVHGSGRLVVFTDSPVRDTNAHLHRAALAIGAPYLPLKARPPHPAIEAHAAASRRWRHAAKRLVAHVAPPGLWRDRWRNLIPRFEDYIAWLAENAALIVSGRFHGVCIALDLGIPVLGVPSNTWKVEALLAHAGLKHRLVSNLEELQHRLSTTGLEPYLYTSTELHRIAAFRKEVRTGARTMFQSICESTTRLRYSPTNFIPERVAGEGPGAVLSSHHTYKPLDAATKVAARSIVAAYNGVVRGEWTKSRAKNPSKGWFDQLIGTLVRRIGRHAYSLAWQDTANALRNELQHRATISAANFVQTRMPDALFCANKFDHLTCAWERVPAGLALEFGVYKGVTINHLARLAPDRQFFGFDSFLGLPEQWSGNRYSKLNFDRKGKVPKVPSNATIVEGWFHETLPGFLAKHNEPIAFMHIDCDIYSSTKTVLDLTAGRLAPGAVLVFDDFFNYLGYELHEYKAFFEFVERFGVEYKFLGYSGQQVSLMIDAVQSSAS
jgi:Polysaccharide pyruvyl transferase/Methyltransferase domain